MISREFCCAFISPSNNPATKVQKKPRFSIAEHGANAILICNQISNIRGSHSAFALQR